MHLGQVAGERVPVFPCLGRLLPETGLSLCFTRGGCKCVGMQMLPLPFADLDLLVLTVFECVP